MVSKCKRTYKFKRGVKSTSRAVVPTSPLNSHCERGVAITSKIMRLLRCSATRNDSKNSHHPELDSVYINAGLKPLTLPSPTRGEGKRCKVAFTLAEVLITLGIIGVVAAMTLPGLIAQHQKKEVAVKLEKAYSELFQAIKVAEKDYGSMDSWHFEGEGIEQIKDFSSNYLFTNIKVIKSCIPSSGECWADSPTSLGGRNLRGYIGNSNARNSSFVTASGYSVYYWLHGYGGWFYVDVNGLKKPNTLGKDIFAFYLAFVQRVSASCPEDTLTKIGFFPVGASCEAINDRDYLLNESQFACKKDRSLTYAGAFCSSVIMFDGWKINKDYPWGQ